MLSLIKTQWFSRSRMMLKVCIQLAIKEELHKLNWIKINCGSYSDDAQNNWLIVLKISIKLLWKNPIQALIKDGSL